MKNKNNIYYNMNVIPEIYDLQNYLNSKLDCSHKVNNWVCMNCFNNHINHYAIDQNNKELYYLSLQHFRDNMEIHEIKPNKYEIIDNDKFRKILYFSFYDLTDKMKITKKLKN
jgi:hypothetical protein